MTGFAYIDLILKNGEVIQIVTAYIYISDVFARINEKLILKNKKETEIERLNIRFKEYK